MKIQLTEDLPVDHKHGMTEGRIFDVVEEVESPGRNRVKWWVVSDAGERVGVIRREAVEVSET